MNRNTISGKERLKLKRLENKELKHEQKVRLTNLKHKNIQSRFLKYLFKIYFFETRLTFDCLFENRIIIY